MGRTGALVFVRVHHEITDAQGVAIVEDQDIVYREMPQAGATPPPLPGGPAVAAAVPAGVDVLTPAQIAQTLGVSEADVVATLEAGDLKGKKIGSSWRVTRAALDAYLAE